MKKFIVTLSLFLLTTSCYQKVKSNGFLGLSQKEMNESLPFVIGAISSKNDEDIDDVSMSTFINYGVETESEIILTKDLCLMSENTSQSLLCIRIKGHPNDSLSSSDLTELQAIGLKNCKGTYSSIENCLKNPTADKNLSHPIRVNDIIYSKNGRAYEVPQPVMIETQSISSFDNTGVFNPPPLNASLTPLLPIICESMPLNNPCFETLVNPSTNKGLQTATSAALLSYTISGIKYINITEKFSFEGGQTGKLRAALSTLFKNNNVPYVFSDLYRDGYTRHGYSLETNYSKNTLEELRVQYLNGPGKMSIVRIPLVSILKR